MKNIAIIGASYLQQPLILKAKNKGIITHVFAWACGDVGEKSADFFYPISIVEKERILEKCKEIGIDGICTIASDLAVITVNYVADKMGLIGNSLECTEVSTNKHKMRECFIRNGDPAPKSIMVESVEDLNGVEIDYPVIVKPVDRSGSRGITKVTCYEDLSSAIKIAKSQGFEKKALVEEFATGQEYSVEYISWQGRHEFLALTRKFTTGAPNFVEIGHEEPALVSEDMLLEVKKTVEHALDSLGIKNGASHSEIKISESGVIKIIEIGARMGGDFIGSSLVELSTGYDFVSAVIDIAMGIEPKYIKSEGKYAGVHFVFSDDDIKCFDRLRDNDSDLLVDYEIREITEKKVSDSSSRFGYFIFSGTERGRIEKYLPQNGIE